MKPFFAKQVTEKPRRGHANLGAKARSFGKIVQTEDGPEYFGASPIPIGRHRQHGWEAKEFTDVLGPIKRFLLSRVGRNWDKVYGELCEHLGRKAWPVRHVMTQHVDVDVKTYRGVDGQIWALNRRGPHVINGGWGSTGFYVEPKTNILRYKRRTCASRPPQTPPGEIRLEDGRLIHQHEGIWYFAQHSQLADGSKSLLRTKQLSRKELREFGLTNVGK